MSQDNTPYDDVFRTLLNDCSRWIIPVINEVFKDAHYTGKEEIVFSPNERFLKKQDGEESKRITDTSFKIMGKEVRKYHLECQSSLDYSMLIRFWEYDTQIALDESTLEGNLLTVTLPQSAILFLRCNSKTPDNMCLRILTPGGAVTYDIAVMKTQNYTLEEIFDKNLLLLIPFYIFAHEAHFEEYAKDVRQLEYLKSQYRYLINKLEELVATKVIDEYTKRTLIDMSQKVLRNITKKHKTVREGVKSVMVGRVLEYEAKTIKKEGIREGIQRGMRQGFRKGVNEGKMEMLFELVHDEQLSVQEAAARVELTEEVFLKKLQEYYKSNRRNPGTAK